MKIVFLYILYARQKIASKVVISINRYKQIVRDRFTLYTFTRAPLNATLGFKLLNPFNLLVATSTITITSITIYYYHLSFILVIVVKCKI